MRARPPGEPGTVHVLHGYLPARQPLGRAHRRIRCRIAGWMDRASADEVSSIRDVRELGQCRTAVHHSTASRPRRVRSATSTGRPPRPGAHATGRAPRAGAPARHPRGGPRDPRHRRAAGVRYGPGEPVARSTPKAPATSGLRAPPPPAGCPGRAGASGDRTGRACAAGPSRPGGHRPGAVPTLLPAHAIAELPRVVGESFRHRPEGPALRLRPHGARLHAGRHRRLGRVVMPVAKSACRAIGGAPICGTTVIVVALLARRTQGDRGGASLSVCDRRHRQGWG